MKSIIICLSIFLLLDKAPDFNSISSALNSADVNALAMHFDEDVEIATPDNEDIYDKVKAKEVVKKFFDSNKPSGFSMKHKGTSNDKGAHYCIGYLNSPKGQIRVYIYLQESGGKFLIQELRFGD